VAEIQIIPYRSYNQPFNMVVVAALVRHLQILAINLFGAAAAVVGLIQPEALVDRPLLAVTAAQAAQQEP
jgi:hypothetical protein